MPIKETVILNKKDGTPFVTKKGKNYFIEKVKYTDDVELILDAIKNVTDGDFNSITIINHKSKEDHWKAHFNYQWQGGGLILWHNPTKLWEDECARRGKINCKVCNTKLVMYYVPVCPLCSKGKVDKKYNLSMMEYYIMEKYNIKNLRDYATTKFNLNKSTSTLKVEHKLKWEEKHFPQFVKDFEKNPIKGYRFNEEGTKWCNSQEGNKFFRDMRLKYITDPEGECIEKQYPYLDFWHFLIDNVDIHNDCTRTFNWKDLKEVATKDWQKEICQYFINEFGEKDMRVEISW